MFFDISAKSQENTFSINENYAGLVLASDINKLSCSIDTNSMNDNIFSNNSGNISNSGSVRNYVDSFKTVIGDFNFSKIIFFKDTIVCCISIPCIQEERKNFSFIYNGRSILFVDYDNFLTDIFSNIIEENINEIEKSNDKIEKITGNRTKIYRAPYGEYNNTVIKATRDKGYFCIQWNLDTLDYTGITGDEMWNRLKEKIKAGDIILSHNGTKHTADSLDMIIKNIKAKGLEVVRISDLIYQENYTINNNGTQIKSK